MAINKIRQYGNRTIPSLKDKIPFSDIINDVVTGGTAKPLSAEAGKGLKADINTEIADRAQAIVDLKGGVTASNSTLKKIEDNLNAEVQDRIDAIAQEVSDRDAAVLVEKNRSVAEEVRIEGKVDANKVTAADATSNEETRAKGEEARIETKLDAEIATTDAEITNLNADENTVGSVDQKVKVEKDARLAAEAIINTNVTNEESARISADNTLQGNIDTLENTVSGNKTAIEASLSAEISTRANADTALSGRLTAVEGTLVAGVTWKGSVADLSGIDALVEDDIIAGQAYYVQAEKDVYVVLPGQDGDYTPAGYTSKSFLKIADFKELTGLVTAEKNRSVAEEARIEGLLSTEVSTRGTEITRVEGLITAEANTRDANDVTLQNNIDTEEAARIAADTAEQSRAEAAELVLRTDIATLNDADTVVGSVAYAVKAEETRAIAAEQANATAISTETTNRIADVDAEESRATTVEGQLDTKIDTEIQDRKDAITTEANARVAADTALDARLDIVEGDKTVVGSIAKAEFDAKSYADLWIPMMKLEGLDGSLSVSGDAITTVYAPIPDGVIFGEVIVYGGDNDSEAIAVNVASISGTTINLDVVTAGEFDGKKCKVQYMFVEGSQSGAGMGTAGEGGAGA